MESAVSVEHVLHSIISNADISILFQPIFDTQAESILGYEALARGPKGSILEFSDRLFKTASDFGVLSELEILCRKKAIEGFVAKSLQGKLFLNVSPKSLLTPDHPKGETLKLLQQFGLDPVNVVIEITEKDKVDDGFLFLKAISHYRKLGFKIAIDDLGAGYSGLKQWSEICPDYVKIDRYFIAHFDQSVVKKEFLKTIIELANVTGTQVIAEGIERLEEFDFLTTLPIRYTQGFLLAKPSSNPPHNYGFAQMHLSDSNRKATVSNLENTIVELLKEQQVIDPRMNCKEAHHLFEKNKQLLCLVICEQEKPYGVLHREQLAEVFASPYGQALYGKRSVTELMDCQPLVVEYDETIDSVSQQVTESDVDIRRNVIVTRDHRFAGIVPIRDLLKRITDEKIKNAQHANPLTLLPGNVAINDAISQRITKQCDFKLAYIDLNHFKQFNDLYGYASGDSVIKLLADVIVQACDKEACFVGHIGGDDFMVVFDSNNASEICCAIIKQFEQRSKQFFTPEHIAEGGYFACNREGKKQFVPLLTLSIGIVHPDPDTCQNSHQIAALATDAKKEAKRFKGSYIFNCNRRRPSEPQVSVARKFKNAN